MKSLLISLFVCTLSLLGIYANGSVDSVSYNETEYGAMHSNDVDADTLLPVEWDYPLGGSFSTDAQSLASQCQMGGRNYRILTSSKFLYLKCLSRTPSVRLTHQRLTDQIHSTFPFLNWEVASEHYIFGMRRILI